MRNVQEYQMPEIDFPHIWGDVEDPRISRADPTFFALAHSREAIVWAAKADGILDFANAYFMKLVGRLLTGTPAWSWPDILHPEDLERVQGLVRASFQRGENFEVSARIRSKEGEFFPFLIRGAYVRGRKKRVVRWFGTAIRTDLPSVALPSPNEADTYLMGMIASQRDLLKSAPTSPEATQLLSSRMSQRLQFMAEASRELTSSLDIQTVIQNLARLAVPRLADWVGVMELHPDGALQNLAHFHRDPGLFHMGWTVPMKYPPKPEDEIQYGSFYVMKTGEPQLNASLSVETLWRLGQTPEVVSFLLQMGYKSWVMAPLKARGRIIGTLAFTSGSSNRQYDESDLQFANEIGQRLSLAIDHARLFAESQKVNQVKDEFLATLSHELRTPLNVIMGHTELLFNDWQGMAPEDVESSLDAIWRNSRSQLQIVEDLLSVSSVILGKIRLSLSPFSIVDLVKETVRRLQSSADAKSLKIEIEVSKAPPFVVGDQERILQVLTNLLGNAIKYTPVAGYAKITVESHDPDVIIAIEDNGFGIEPQFLPFVFDRFRQEDTSSTRRFGGLGLGLSIVRNLVELHDGTVRVESQGRNQGSRFTVTLPIAGPQFGVRESLES